MWEFIFHSINSFILSSFQNVLWKMIKKDIFTELMESWNYNHMVNKWKNMYRAFSISLLHAIIAHNHLPFLKIFSNYAHFCPFFSNILSFFTLNFFLPFFWKIACISLLSRIGPDIVVSCNYCEFLVPLGI